MIGKRITLVSTFAPDDCGIASYTSYLANALIGADAAIHVSVVTPSGAAASEERIEVIPYPTPDEDYTSTLEQTIAATRPDVIHIQHEYGIFGADDRFIRLLSRLAEGPCPVIVTMHTVHTSLSVDLGCGWTRGFSLEGLSIEPYQRTIGELADLIIVHHDSSVRRTLIRQGLAQSKVVAIAHGTLVTDQAGAMDAAELVPAGRPLLVAPGYFRRSKNTEMLIDAFAAVADGRPAATLWIGAYLRDTSTEALSYLDSCLARAADAGLEDKVVFGREPISEAAMTGLLASADLVLCAYDEDTRSASGILHRAIGAGATVVASRRPKFQELADVCDELLVDPDRPAELARLVDRLLDDGDFLRAVRRPLGELALRTAWPVVARSHLEAYARVGAIPKGAAQDDTFSTTVERDLYELSAPRVH